LYVIGLLDERAVRPRKLGLLLGCGRLGGMGGGFGVLNGLKPTDAGGLADDRANEPLALVFTFARSLSLPLGEDVRRLEEAVEVTCDSECGGRESAIANSNAEIDVMSAGPC